MAVVLTGGSAPSAHALGPHEVLVLANGRSADSVALASFYAGLRRIPEANIVRLVLPDRQAPHRVTPDEFTRLIWNPANRALRERGLGGQILAWVYSIDMPVLVATEPPISIQGLTFLRNQPPDPHAVKWGEYVSPLYGATVARGQKPYMAQSFDTMREWLGGNMPLPSMMLGYRGKNGNRLEAIRDCLRRGTAADGSAPSGTVYLVQSDDVRSRCREWQQEPALDDLKALGIQAVIVKEPLGALTDVLGMQIGLARVDPARHRYLPGSMAEHLTSAGAEFWSDHQTKISAWIAAGATATAGAVTEPYANWAKFPSAHFYYFYASGCTMIESFFQSIRCPLQILLVGEPLAAPWAGAGALTVAGLSDGATVGELRTVRPAVAGGIYPRTFVYLLDGRRVDEGRLLRLDPAKLSSGDHTLRIVAYGTGMVRRQVFEDIAFTVPEP